MRESLERLGTDLRRAFRALIRRPVYAIGAALVLGGGIAATTAVFALVLNTLVRPLPFAEPGRLAAFEVRGAQGFDISVSIPNYYAWKERQKAFDKFAAVAGWGFLLRGASTGMGEAGGAGASGASGTSGASASEVVNARGVLGDFFELLGFQPAQGRLFTASESEKGAVPVAVLGDGFWRRRFGADPSLVGKTIELDGKAYTVSGVLPAGVGYPSAATELYFPMGVLADSLPWENRGSSFGTRILTRRAPDISLAAANADMQRVDREVKAEFGANTATPRVIDLADVFLAERRDADRLLAGLVACFFLIAVVNVLLLALARAEERRPEMAVRAALGASAAQNRRLLFAEALCLGVFGLVLGIGGAVVLLAAGSSWVAQGVPLLVAERVRVDGWAVAMAVGLAGIAVSVLALGPARLLRVVNGGARAGALQRTARRYTGFSGVARRFFDLRGVLIASEIALTLVLVSLASLLARSQTLVDSIDKGFATSGVLTARIGAPQGYFKDVESWRSAWTRMIEGAAALPGAEQAAASLLVPLGGRSWEQRVQPSERPWERDNGDSMLFNIVSENYFRTMGVPILRGRGFEAQDREGSPPVAVVDELLAERYWPGQDPLGKTILMEAYDPNASHHELGKQEPRTVIGVARNVRHYQVETASRIQVYIPLQQTAGRFGMGLNLDVSTRRDPNALLQPIRDLVGRIDPALAVSDALPLQTRVQNALANRRSTQQWSTLLGVISLGLALAGIFAVTSYAVVQRHGELGIRAALGATRGDLIREVARRSLSHAVAGALVGVILAVAGAPLVRGLLYGVGPFDPRGILSGFLVVVVAAFTAAVIPAWRAARVEPAAVLRPGERMR